MKPYLPCIFPEVKIKTLQKSVKIDKNFMTSYPKSDTIEKQSRFQQAKPKKIMANSNSKKLLHISLMSNNQKRAYSKLARPPQPKSLLYQIFRECEFLEKYRNSVEKNLIT